MKRNSAGGELFTSFKEMLADVAAGYAALWSRISGLFGSAGSAAGGAAGGAVNAATGVAGRLGGAAENILKVGSGFVANAMGVVGSFYKKHPLIATVLLAGGGIKLFQDRGEKRDLQAQVNQMQQQLAMDRFVNKLDRAAVCQDLGEMNPTPRTKNYWQNLTGRSNPAVPPVITDPTRTGN